MKSAGTDFKLIKTEDVTIDGMKGFSMEFTFKPAGTTEYKSSGVMITGKDGVYAFLYSTVELNGSKYDDEIKTIIDGIKKN